MTIEKWGRSRLAFIGLIAVATLLAVLVPGGAALAAIAIGPTTTALNAGGASDINEVLKIYFNDPIVENYVSDSELMKYFEEDSNVKQDETTGGKYIETAQYFQLPAGVGARAENEYIPIPDGPLVRNSRVYLKKIQGVIEMTGDVMRRVRGDMGAYMNYLERAMPDLVTRLTNESDRMALGYGAGVKARIQALPGGVILRVNRSMGATINGVALTDAYLQFMEGERIVASANVTGAPIRNAGAGQSARIVKVDGDMEGSLGYCEITVDAIPGAWAPDDYLFAGDAAGVSTQDAGGLDREFMGLLGMVDDGTVLATFQNLVRATYKLWNSVSIDASVAPHNGSLTENVLTLADDDTFVKGGGKPNLVVSSRSGARSYANTLRGDRIINDPRGYVGGNGKLSIMFHDRTAPIQVCRKMPPELTFGVQTDTIKRWTLGGYQWDDTTGAIWNRVTDGTGRKDAFYGVGNLYKQLGNLAPRKSFRIGGLSRA